MIKTPGNYYDANKYKFIIRTSALVNSGQRSRNWT